VTIRGSGQVLTRDLESSSFRFFQVTPTGSLTLENLELNNGRAVGGNGADGGGGAAGLGGAIFNQGTLVIRNSLHTGNTAQGGDANGAGPGGGSQVIVIDGTKLGLKGPDGRIAPEALYGSFFAFAPGFTGGVFVGAGNLDGDKYDDIVVGPLTAGSPQVVVFNGVALRQVASRFAIDSGLRTGIRLTVADVNGDRQDEVVSTAGPGGGPQTVIFDPITGRLIESSYFSSDTSNNAGNGVG